MRFLSTGTIDNSLVGGVRQTQQVTIKIVNRDPVNFSIIALRGYILNGTETLYVNELFSVNPNQVITRNYTTTLISNSNLRLADLQKRKRVYPFGERIQQVK